ncbi:MAG TPA: S-layer homology domain-containing protein [Fimbriimonadaceae bacterium]|nr:S-layer homology domain-containing protein [Fimbriimonadaceae bacterium]
MNRTFKYALSAALSALLIVPALAQDNFPDVPDTHWAYKDLERMKAEGLLVGYPDGLFRGSRPASRYELAVACHAVWANLKGIVDGLNSQIADLNSKLANAATKADLDSLRSQIDALTAEQNRIKNEDIANLRKMADEFRSELTKLGADVDAMKKDLDDMKGKVDWLWQHKLPFDVSGDANFWMGSAYSRNVDGGGFGITVDGRPEGVKRDGSGNPGGGTEDLTILHENALKIVSNNESGPTLKATMVMGNMMGGSNFLASTGPGLAFGDQSSVFPGIPFSEANESWYFQEFSVNFDTSILGLGFNAEVGRTGYKVSPYIFQRPDTTPYYANDRWDNGNWMIDGAVLGFHFGGAKLDVFGGRTGSQMDTGFGNIQPMFAGAAGNPFSPGMSVGRPRGFYRNNDFGNGGMTTGLSIDQALGLNLSVPISHTGALNLAYLWLDSDNPLAVIGNSSGRDANRVNVYGGDLKFNFSNIDVTAGYSKADVMSGTHTLINKNNAAWYGALGYSASNWGVKAGYRRVEPQFGAPGDWGRIGIWWNPTDIKGWYGDFHYDLNKDIRLMANGGAYSGTNTTLNGVTGLGTDDHLSHASVGIGYKMGGNHTLMLGYEGVWWDLKDRPGVGFIGGKPTEQWFNIGWGVDLSARAKFSVLWQISQYDSKSVAEMGPFGFGPGGAAGQTKAEGGLITTQLTFKF